MSAGIILLIIAFIMGAVGIIFTATALGLGIFAKRKREICTQPVQAVIADLERSDNISMEGIRTVSWFPVYEYFIRGKRIRKRSHLGSAQQDFYIGQEVTIYVNPENANEFYCPQEKTGKLRVIFLLIGILLIIMAAAAGILRMVLL